MVNRCAGSLSTSSSRDLSDGNGGTYKEYGYYGATPEDMSGKTIMMDIPFFYFDDNDKHNWNNTMVLVTGSYTTTDTQRWYAASGSNAPELYLHNAEIYGIGTNSKTGQQTGLELGYIYDSMDISIKDTTLNPVATIVSGMAYKSSGTPTITAPSSCTLRMLPLLTTRDTMQVGVATRTTDMCVYMTGTDGSYIKDSTFDDCGTGIYTVRSPYYYTHSTTEYGADNLTIEGNEFLNGGEIADIWVGRNAYSEGMLIKGNWFNSSSSDGGVEVFNGFTERVTVQDNYFNGPRTAVQMIGTDGYVIDNNEIIGTSERLATLVLKSMLDTVSSPTTRFWTLTAVSTWKTQKTHRHQQHRCVLSVAERLHILVDLFLYRSIWSDRLRRSTIRQLGVTKSLSRLPSLMVQPIHGVNPTVTSQTTTNTSL